MAPVQLDHVVALLPYKDILDPPEWIRKNFSVSPGGRHADGKTENRLILFKDGTYLELIAFVNDDQDKRRGHFWDRSFGIVDYALTTLELYDFDPLQARLKQSGAGIEYALPQTGGRVRPDGVELKWEVTFPKGAKRGEVPFWCHDLTPRERRVPITDESSDHPCGAVGMSGVVLSVDRKRVEHLTKAIFAITGDEGTLGTPLSLAQRKKPSVRIEQNDQLDQDHQLSLVLHTTNTELPANIEESVGNGQLSIKFEGAQT
jgi:Glyoxalase-like domain